MSEESLLSFPFSPPFSLLRSGCSRGGHAYVPHRANSAPHHARGADERAEFHQGLIGRPRRIPVAWHQHLRRFPELAISGCALLESWVEDAPQNARALVSIAGSASSNAKLATAPAVYAPTPGRDRRIAVSRGTSP